MKSIIARVRRSTFIKNVAVLASGTAMAQAIVVLAAPVLSRFYSPTAFGVMSVVLAVSAPIAALASFKYELAIVLAKDEKDASNLLILAGGLVVAVSLVTLLIIPFAGEWLAIEMGRPTAAPLMLWIPALVFINGVHNTLLFWANRRRDYFWQSAATVGRSVGMVAVQVILGFADRGAKGLIVGRLFGLTLATVILGVQTLKNEWRAVLQSFDPARIRELAREHDHFPKYNAPRESIVSFSGSVPTFFLAIFFTPAAAGLYWFTVRLLEVPTTLIGIAVRRVFYERATTAFHREEEIYPLLAKATVVLAALGFLPVVIISVVGPDLFGFVFGEEWRGAGIYARWLTIWWFSSFCNVAASALIPIFRLQPLFLGIEIVGLILRTGAIALAAFVGDDVLAVALYSIVGFSLNAYRIGYVMNFAKHKQGTLPV